MVNILTEASGSMTSTYLISAIQEAGYQAVASDIVEDIAGRYLADDFILMPKSNDPNLWTQLEQKLEQHHVDFVIPSLDETLLEWSKRKSFFKEKGIGVFVSDEEVVKVFQDKWLTYEFFKKNNIPTPSSSLKQDFPLVKPRFGRGSVGVVVTAEQMDMKNNISQEFIEGTEYTIDVFCDKNSNPVYIIPRKRLNVKEGKSTAGIVVSHPSIESYVRKICSSTSFIGPINIQCIEKKDGSLFFIEINPRIAGGMALGFAASENWVKLLVEHLVLDYQINPKSIKYGLKMMRFYNEIFV